MRRVSEAIDTLHDQWVTVKYHVTKALGIQDPIRVMPYFGYGTPHKLHLKGRVLQDEGIKLREEDASLWKNLVNMYRRFETDEVPGVQVQIHVDGQEYCAITNKEGFFETSIDLQPPLTGDRLWQPIDLKLITDKYPLLSDSEQGEAIVVSDKAKFGVISDIDDTIVYTAATELLKMIRIAYMGNERTRRPFPGVPQFYQALQAGVSEHEGNPIFYVSSSAWNMYDLFAKFMDINGVPKGPMHLHDIEFTLEKLLAFDHATHKREQIDPIFDRFSELSFILIGDTGQKDAEIYSKLAHDFPGRILAIYLRNVTPNDHVHLQAIDTMMEPLRQQGVTYQLFSHTAIAAQHAAEHDWISSHALETVMQTQVDA
ncbi:App1 family protein [Vacuolonema iberomarrocanum]|uniref:App1 family protein n=1 Tax=Vacuolonema iberomarrocanum TaxID=3454632 RepID=UPI0019E8E6C9|nr:DUF2183 domain-containing protein [filamentous cyanobacterium LEGE 07170]